MMEVFYNSTRLTAPDNTSLFTLLNEKAMAEKPGIAVAVNETVVPRKEWDNFMLKDGDKILVIKATQGG